jgi:hypothetical protein
MYSTLEYWNPSHGGFISLGELQKDVGEGNFNMTILVPV